MDKLPQRYRRLIAAGLAALMAGGLAGCALLPKEEEALAPPLVKPAAENYQTVEAVKGTIENVLSISAAFESIRTDVAQFTGTGGRIFKINVTPGDQVKKGDVLAELVMSDLDLQVKEQELSLEKAKLALNAAAKHTAGGAGEDAKAELRIATLQRDIEQMKYERLREQYENKLLKANIDGQVVFVEDLNPGDYVDTYQTLVTVADPSKMQLMSTGASADQLRKVEVGFKAAVTYKDADGKEVNLEATVTQTPSTAPQTLNKQLAEKYASTLYLSVGDIPKGVEIGQSADIKIVLQRKDNVIKIPRSGLRTSMGRNYVRVLQDGKLREIDVEPGIAASTEVEIVTGLSEGASVVLQ